MQSFHPIEPQSADISDVIHQASVVPSASYTQTEDTAQPVNEPTKFYSRYVDSMEMNADVDTVSRYLDRHQEWFYRCALPMKTEAIGKNSYALVIGRFGSFGFEVEPKIGLDLLPQEDGVYRIETVPVPDYAPVGYDVDFKAAMELVDISAEQTSSDDSQEDTFSTPVTRVQWQLDLTVFIQFPRFIHALPKPLIQSTGDRVLQQVVRQVSGRLTRKVLEDFHGSHNLPIPKKSKRWFFRKPEEVDA